MPLLLFMQIHDNADEAHIHANKHRIDRAHYVINFGSFGCPRIDRKIVKLHGLNNQAIIKHTDGLLFTERFIGGAMEMSKIGHFMANRLNFLDAWQEEHIPID